MQRRYWASIEDVNRVLQVTNIVDPLDPNAVPIEGVTVQKARTDNTLVLSKIINRGTTNSHLTFANGTVLEPGIKFTRTGSSEITGIYYTTGAGIDVTDNGQRVGEFSTRGLGISNIASGQTIDFHNATITNILNGASTYSYIISGQNVSIMDNVTGELLRIPMTGSPNKSIVLSVNITANAYMPGVDRNLNAISAQFIAQRINGQAISTVSNLFNIHSRMYYPIYISITSGNNEIIISAPPHQNEMVVDPAPYIWTTQCEIQRIEY